MIRKQTDELIERLDQQAASEPGVWMRVAAERLSLLRYVFLVQVEDGIPSASQRAALEYADAVLIGWPDDKPGDAETAPAPDAAAGGQVREAIGHIEASIPKFRACERRGNVDGLARSLVGITRQVARVRRFCQPDFPLPTYGEIQRVVEEEWNADMDDIAPTEENPTPEEIKQLGTTGEADGGTRRGANGNGDGAADGSHDVAQVDGHEPNGRQPDGGAAQPAAKGRA